MRVYLDASPARLLGDMRPDGLELAGGTRVVCDMVVFATGIRPHVELAAHAGFAVERGIVVDDAMRALGCESVYAVGECIHHRGEVYRLTAPIWEQAAVLADRITRADPAAEHRGSKLATNGKLVGAILLGDLAKASFLTQAFDRGTVLPQERTALLFDLDGPADELGAEELPDDAQICNCNGVSKRDIRACVLAGKRSMAEVGAATRAGTGCGSCRERVLDVIAWASTTPLTWRAA
jgi:nitrite reductase (NADH) large subunit